MLDKPRFRVTDLTRADGSRGVLLTLCPGPEEVCVFLKADQSDKMAAGLTREANLARGTAVS